VPTFKDVIVNNITPCSRTSPLAGASYLNDASARAAVAPHHFAAPGWLHLFEPGGSREVVPVGQTKTRSSSRQEVRTMAKKKAKKTKKGAKKGGGGGGGH
jgi:hypothetical protein